MHHDVYNLWVTVQRAPDLRGIWLAHCLDFDVMSQGSTPREAVSMVCEAIDIVLEADRAVGRDPYERRAPESDWAEMFEAVREGEPGAFADVIDRPIGDEDEDRFLVVALEIFVRAPATEFRTPVAFRQSA
jgi:predicted RNase H-like HicB family nuclease